MRKLLFLAGMTAACGLQAETNIGVAYSTDEMKSNLLAPYTDHKTQMLADFWVAGTPNGPLMTYFKVWDSGNGGNASGFTASKINSFSAYYDAFFGKVVDVWMDGQYQFTPVAFSPGGQSTVAHVRATHSDFPGSTFAYMTVDIYLPNNLNTPIFSRVAFTDDRIDILIPPDAGFKANDGGTSNRGIISSFASLALTNRIDTLDFTYNIAFNGIQQMTLFGSTSHMYFQGTRLDSFACDNNGFFGKQAEVWAEGYLSDGPSVSGRPAVAHMIVTHTGSYFAWDTIYVAVYLPGHLDKALYERDGVVVIHSNNILCR